MNEEILRLAELLEALRFLTQSLDSQWLDKLNAVRSRLDSFDRSSRIGLRKSLRAEIAMLRRHYGAFASDDRLVALLREARANPGYVYLPKLTIERDLFRHYHKVFPRWPHIPLHALVIFDGRTNRPMNQVFLAESLFFSDAKYLIEQARRFHKGIETMEFRRRSPEDQTNMLTYVRSAVGALYHSLEAYLNGLAYDCFTAYHDDLQIEEHDILAEWSSKKKRRSFVQFERKLHEYPSIVARTLGRSLDMSASEAAKLLSGYGKDVRDALTHPSSFINPATRTQTKIWHVASLNLDATELILQKVREYILAVESGLGRRPEKTVPWLFEKKRGDPYGK